jgi:hypothetical protein
MTHLGGMPACEQGAVLLCRTAKRARYGTHRSSIRASQPIHTRAKVHCPGLIDADIVMDLDRTHRLILLRRKVNSALSHDSLTPYPPPKLKTPREFSRSQKKVEQNLKIMVETIVPNFGNFGRRRKRRPTLAGSSYCRIEMIRPCMS